MISFTTVLAMVTGWGRLFDNGKFAHILQKVQVPLFPLQTCLNIYINAGYGDYVSQCTVCGGGTLEHEADSCQVLISNFKNTYFYNFL